MAALRAGIAQIIAWCHYLLIPYILLGWAAPHRGWLIVHALAVPLLILQWIVNRQTCVLANIVSWLRTGRWWDETDPDQGAWIATLIRRFTGIGLTPIQVNALVYGLVLTAWAATLIRLAAGMTA